jgi:enamine deaminase RidA (YjgF/YER057c/UK114 family)
MSEDLMSEDMLHEEMAPARGRVASRAWRSAAEAGKDQIGEDNGHPRFRSDPPHVTTLPMERKNTMTGTVERKLSELGISLPTPASPIANYIPYVRTGALLFVSGQVCLDANGKLVAKGKLGAGVALDEGQKAARACAINVLAQVKAAIGDLDKVARVVRLGGFISSDPGFLEGPKVMNGASDLMVAAFGEKGRHARTTVGVAVLPGDAAVEVDGIFEVA